MYRLLKSTVFLLIILPNIKSYPSDSIIGIHTNSITIAGFKNNGAGIDNDFNTELTKALITYMKLHYPRFRITSYSDVKNYTFKTGNRGTNIPGIDKEMEMADFFGSDILVTGDYLFNNANNTVNINISIYNIYKKDLIDRINYHSPTDINLLDTIDTIDVNIAGFFAGKFTSQTKSTSYDVYISGTNSTISLNTNYSTNSNRTNLLGLHYEKSIPWMDIILPGFAQFQASDYWMGSLFSAAGGLSAGLIVVSILGYNSIEQRYGQAVKDSMGTEYENSANEWIGIMAGSAVILACSAGLSYFHADEMKQQELKAFSLDCSIGSEYISFNIIRKF